MATTATNVMRARGISTESVSLNRARVFVEPLERGFGHTLGNALRRRERFARRTQQKGHVGEVLLPRRIERRFDLPALIFGFGVSHDADDFDFTFLADQRDSLAEYLFIGEELVRKGLADDGDVRPSRRRWVVAACAAAVGILLGGLVFHLVAMRHPLPVRAKTPADPVDTRPAAPGGAESETDARE